MIDLVKKYYKIGKLYKVPKDEIMTDGVNDTMMGIQRKIFAKIVKFINENKNDVMVVTKTLELMLHDCFQFNILYRYGIVNNMNNVYVTGDINGKDIHVDNGSKFNEVCIYTIPSQKMHRNMKIDNILDNDVSEYETKGLDFSEFLPYVV